MLGSCKTLDPSQVHGELGARARKDVGDGGKLKAEAEAEAKAEAQANTLTYRCVYLCSQMIGFHFLFASKNKLGLRLNGGNGYHR